MSHRQVIRLTAALREGDDEPPQMKSAPAFSFRRSAWQALSRTWRGAARANAQLEQEVKEHRRTEEALAKRTAELEDARSFLDSVLENLPVMLFVKDAKELKFVRWNRAEEQALGIDRSAAIGRSDYDFFPEEQASFFVAKDRAVLNGGQMVDIPE